MTATAGNIQGWKMYAHNAMGDSEVAAFVGSDIMHRAHAHCISVYGPLHSKNERAMGRMEPLGMPGSNRGKGSY
jgi:hypothetical protein